MSEIRVLFVCMGNICRSPTAEGVFRKVVESAGLAHRIHIDSAGTHAYHVGEQPDRRAQETALTRGIDLSAQRARKVHKQDFAEFDLVLAMDSSNYADLTSICPVEHQERVRLFLEFAESLNEQDVPDPYYGGPSGFERVFDLVEEASAGLLAYLREKHSL